MIGLEELLAERWIVKGQNKELYYLVKDNIEEIRKYAVERMGCQVIVNSSIIKLEKIPTQPDEYMGINDFVSSQEYALLCIVLMYLEDKEAQEQFVLSQLTEFISSHMPGLRVDWTVYTTRKQLIRVLKYCLDNWIIKITDGDEDEFTVNESTEVLYENTGISKYFMRSFTKDITQYRTVEEFSDSDWVDVNEDRGIVRRHRIYKRLLFSPGIYRNDDGDEDFAYLKNYGNRLADDFEEHLNCRLQIYKNSAYLIMNEENHMGIGFPMNNSISDIVILTNGYFRKQIDEGKLKPDSTDMIYLDKAVFEQHLLECRKLFGAGMMKTYRDKTSSEFVKILESAMISYGFI